MKTTMLLVALCATVLARPQELSTPRSIIPIVEHEEVRDENGQYSLRYVGGDGTIATEQGSLKLNANGTGHVLIKQGSVRYYAPDGTPIALDWVADENGFRATGSHLPVAPVSAVDA